MFQTRNDKPSSHCTVTLWPGTLLCTRPLVRYGATQSLAGEGLEGLDGLEGLEGLEGLVH